MRERLRGIFDPFIVMLLGVVCLATLLPARGAWVQVADVAADAAIVLLFLLHGAKLSSEAILAGIRNWRLHLAVFASTFVLFPLLGVGIAGIPAVPEVVAGGMLFLCLLPSTVQSSIAFTAIARGNVAAAVCSASFSNMAGIFLTPLLVALLMRTEGTAAVSLSSVGRLVLQLLLPFAVGHLLRPWLAPWLQRCKPLVSVVDRGSILLVVYAAFGAAVVAGLWERMPPSRLALVAALCAGLLCIVLSITWAAGRWLGFPRGDRIALQFCGSKKSLVSGVPIAGVLFPPSVAGQLLLPLMLFHQMQLIACALLARRYASDDTDV